MHISIGTQNKGKIQALQNALLNYDQYKDATVMGIDVDSGVDDQPIGLDAITQGAMNRAQKAFESGDYTLGFGLESGIFEVPHTKSGYMDTSACAIYDGKQFHLGFSSCFEYPAKMIEKVLQEGKEITDAALDLGFADDPAFREGKGMVGVLTKDKLTRIDYSEQGIHMAMIHLLNPTHY